MEALTAVTGKTLPLRALADLLEPLRASGKRIVHCHGVFDLLHPGHVRHFAAARKQGDILVVTITPDRFVNKGPNRPVFPAELRAESIAALADVDYVSINEWPTAVEAIQLLRPHIYAKGSDYRHSTLDITGNIDEERRTVEATGGRMYFTDDIIFSSSKILNEHFDVLPKETRDYMRTFRENHPFSAIRDMIERLRTLRVLIVGDAIIDEYHQCKAIGMASKAATLNTRYIGEEHHAGGALAVANHVAGFCNNVQLVTLLGYQDSRERFIRDHLKPNITPTFIINPSGTTTVKRRYIDTFRYQKMFEVTFLHEGTLPEDLEQSLHEHLEQKLPMADLVLVADFGHGLISKNTVELLAETEKFLAMTVQTNSANFGYNLVTRYKKASYVCVDEQELRLAYHDRFGPREVRIEQLARQLSASVVTVTLGQKGSVSYAPKTGYVATPAFCGEVIDTVGAGDAYLALSACALAADLPLPVAAFLGNTAGAMASRILGNREAIDRIPFLKFCDTLLK